MTLGKNKKQMCAESKLDFSDFKVLFLNCTLKTSSELSHMQGLIDIAIGIMEKNAVSVECLRPVDFDIATGVWPDMTEHGWDQDAWPPISEKVMAADILVLGSTIWLGKKRRCPCRPLNDFMRSVKVAMNRGSSPTMVM